MKKFDIHIHNSSKDLMIFTVEADTCTDAEEIALKKFLDGLQLSIGCDDTLLSRKEIS